MTTKKSRARSLARLHKLQLLKAWVYCCSSHERAKAQVIWHSNTGSRQSFAMSSQCMPSWVCIPVARGGLFCISGIKKI